jgi:serine/threonine protein kinase
MIGQQVGNYIIERELGRGGMGAVYGARHTTLGRPAAVKVLLPQFTATPDIVQRFVNEAKAATSIRHLGIVEIYDFGLMNTGVAFIAMELLNGESLAKRIAHRRMSIPGCLATIRQMCGALGAAHDLGIIHRDLKPDNVFLIPDPEVPGGERIKLLDFGIAKLSQDASETANQTRTGTLMGTPKYMSPEQCRGVRVDHRADIYALGCILYELITGQTPFHGEGVGDILAAHIYAAPRSIDRFVPGAPPNVVRLVARLLAKDPADRPQTARQLIQEIDELGVSFSAGDAQSTVPVATQATNASDVPTSQLTGVPTVAGMASARAHRGNLHVQGEVTALPTTLSGAATSTLTRNRLRRWRSRLVGACAAAALVGVVVIIVGVIQGRRPSTSRGAAGAMGDASAVVVSADALVAPDPVAITQPLDAGITVAVVPDAVPAHPWTVRVMLDSVPRGAHVWLDGAELGVTPYTGALPMAERKVVFSLRLDDYKEYRVEANVSADIHTSVRLVARDAGASHPRPGHAGDGPGTGRATATPPVTRPAAPTHTPMGDDDTPNPLSAH